MLSKKQSDQVITTAWDGDQLGRSEIAKYLTPLVASIKQPFVIALNSPYGTGKTYFIRNWVRQLQDEGYKAVYFNAWETDYTDDALIAFISSIKEQLQSSDAKSAEKLVGLAKRGGAYIARKLVPVVIKGIARKAIGDEAVKEVLDLADETDDDVVEMLGGFAEDSLAKHEQMRDSVIAFRKHLETIIEELTEKSREEKKKLIVFIDELDRCRPTYAVEVLECIKHLFNVRGIVFILAIDEEQMKGSIASVYGEKIDGENYTRKFIDWNLNLPKPSAKEYAAYLFENFSLQETGHFAAKSRGLEDSKECLILSFSFFSHIFDLSLREQSQCFTEINLAYRTLSGGKPETFVSGMLPVLRLKLRERLVGCFERGADPDTILNLLDERVDVEFAEGHFSKSWFDVKTFIHAALINNEMVLRYMSEREEVKKIVKMDTEASADGKNRDRLAYLDNLDLISRGMAVRRAGGSYDSVASGVYKRFEAAARFRH